MREERIRITIQTKDLSHEKEIRELWKNLPIVRKRDTLVLNYDLNISYFGEVSRNLGILERLLDSKTIELVNADLNCLNDARCLFQDIILKLDRIAT